MRMCFRILVLTLIAPIVIADGISSHRIYAKPVQRTPPRYPPYELEDGRQGWVDLNFVVTKEGEVIEPVIEASSGSRAFERAAIRTVENWRYEPALLNGEPVQQCKTAVRISFTVEGAEAGVSRGFYRKYKRIGKALDRGEVDSASAELDNALQSKGLSLSELSWLWALKSRIAEIQGDREMQLVAVRRALAIPSGFVPDQQRAGLLTTHIALAILKSNFAEALDAYSELKAIDGADTSELDPVIRHIQSLVDSSQLLYSLAEIGSDRGCETCTTQWRYRPMRRAFEITDVNGALGNLELRCEWQRYVDEARENVVWNIPASWGECSVVVHGERGSTFKLVELPDAG